MNNEVLLKALLKMGIKAEAGGRNDLHIDNKKISGSAYKLKLAKKDGTGQQSLHHGTMLLNLELDALGKYLNPSKAKLESKGVTSVVSHVVNLSEIDSTIDHEKFCQALTEAFIEKWSPEYTPKEQVLAVEDLKQNEQIVKIFDETSKWDWVFGETP